MERNRLLTFSPVLPSRTVLVVTPRNPETDFSLFTRPFTDDSWVAIWLIFLIGALFIGLPYLFIEDVEGTNGHQASEIKGPSQSSTLK